MTSIVSLLALNSEDTLAFWNNIILLHMDAQLFGSRKRCIIDIK